MSEDAASDLVPSEPANLNESSTVPDAFSDEGIHYIERLLRIEATWKGPVPPPAAVAAFEQIQPGSANRIIGMAEKEQQTRHRVQIIGAWGEAIRTVGGMLAAFVLAVLLIVTSGYLVLEGHDWAGVSIGGGTLVALVTVFLRRPSDDDESTSTPKKRRRSGR